MENTDKIENLVKTEIKQAVQEALKKVVPRIVISNKSDENYIYKKIDIRLVTIKGKEQYQITSYTDKQAFQSNIDKVMLLGKLMEIFPDKMKQMNVFSTECEYSFKMSKKGKLLKNENKNNKTKLSKYEGQNRVKNYILKEGMIIPPLVDMGIFTKDGKIVKSMYDKYKQINRFVEMVDDVLKDDGSEVINIIDFGCGKSYLTFVLYYYLVEIKNKRTNIVGLDLKEDVIEKCNKAAKKYGYDRLKFELGDINGYQSDMPVDMVVTLHACDTATDYALYNAVKWDAKYILSVPCCQHEVNKQIKCEDLAPIMKYGILKERMSALATDGLRGNMLEYCGYRTQLLEFVDMAHSPKNILIRAVKGNISKEKSRKALEEAKAMCQMLGVEPQIVKLLGK